MFQGIETIRPTYCLEYYVACLGAHDRKLICRIEDDSVSCKLARDNIGTHGITPRQSLQRRGISSGRREFFLVICASSTHI